MTLAPIESTTINRLEGIHALIFSHRASIAAELVEAACAAGVGRPAVETFASAEAVASRLRAAADAVALVDLDGDAEPGLASLKLISETAPGSPLIAVTASQDEWLAVGALQLGAQECLVRGTDDLRPDLLRRALRNAVLRQGTAVEQQLERAFDEAPIGMAILDADMRLMRVNRAVTRMLGRSRGELLGHTLEEFTRPEAIGEAGGRPGPLHPVTDGQQTSERCLVHADGREIWVELAISSMGDVQGSAPRIVAQLQDVTERRQQVEHLRHIADHDPLTGLLNRRGFDRELAAHLNRVSRYGATGALLIFDLDNFKMHNDNFGHDAGDALLSRLGASLRRRLRSSDVVGRFGGDEFAVLLPDADRDRAVLVTRILLDQVKVSTGALLSKSGGGTTASIGMVCFQETGPLHIDMAKRYADEAMYAAKRRGGDQFAEWAPWAVLGEAIGTAA